MAANAAGPSPIFATCAAAIPLPAVPAANPAACSFVIFIPASTARKVMAAMTPPAMARDAVNAGCPPICAATEIAMGVVTALGNIAIATPLLPPSNRTKKTPLTMETTDPASKPKITPRKLRRTCARFFASGTPNATVAGASRKVRVQVARK